ncbi:MAG: hypothetical protein EOO04_38550, partial [Chitinophagaceae bacterium]
MPSGPVLCFINGNYNIFAALKDRTGMKIQFFLRFHTQPGQKLSIVGDIPQLGSGNQAQAFDMQYLNSEYWHAGIEADPA